MKKIAFHWNFLFRPCECEMQPDHCKYKIKILWSPSKRNLKQWRSQAFAKVSQISFQRELRIFNEFLTFKILSKHWSNQFLNTKYEMNEFHSFLLSVAYRYSLHVQSIQRINSVKFIQHSFTCICVWCDVNLCITKIESNINQFEYITNTSFSHRIIWAAHCLQSKGFLILQQRRKIKGKKTKYPRIGWIDWIFLKWNSLRWKDLNESTLMTIISNVATDAIDWLNNLIRDHNQSLVVSPIPQVRLDCNESNLSQVKRMRWIVLQSEVWLRKNLYSTEKRSSPNRSIYANIPKCLDTIGLTMFDNIMDEIQTFNKSDSSIYKHW